MDFKIPVTPVSLTTSSFTSSLLCIFLRRVWCLGLGVGFCSWCWEGGREPLSCHRVILACQQDWRMGQLSRSTAFSSINREQRSFLTGGTNDVLNHSSKIVAVIQAFLECVYWTGMVAIFMWCRHLGERDFPMHSSISLWDPVLLQQNRRVIQSFCSLTPALLSFSLFTARVRSGSIFGNSPVSSQL